MNERGPHFSNCVVELSGTDDHLHLKDVPFGHAPLNQTLQHLLLVQPDISEKKQRECEKTQPHARTIQKSEALISQRSHHLPEAPCEV